jgi:hypothetical protein
VALFPAMAATAGSAASVGLVLMVLLEPMVL